MLNALQISEASNIAIHALALLNAAGHRRRLSVAQIAHVLDVSKSHLAKVMQKLVRGGMVDSIRGAKGGFSLKKAPSRITLWHVVKVVDGEPRVGSCLFGDHRCRNGSCVISEIQYEVSSLAVKRLKEIKISDFPHSFDKLEEL